MPDLKIIKRKFKADNLQPPKFIYFSFILLTSIKYIYVLVFLIKDFGPTFSTAYNHTFLRPHLNFYSSTCYSTWLYIYSYSYSLIHSYKVVTHRENGGCYFVDNRNVWSKWVWIIFNCRDGYRRN